MIVCKSNGQMPTRVQPVAGSLARHGMARAVIAGTRPGLVVTDSSAAPTALAIIAPEGHFAWVYLGGSVNDKRFVSELSRWMFEQRGVGPSADRMLIVWDADGWEESLSELIAPRQIVPERRLHYVYSRNREQRTPQIASGYRIEPLRRELLSKGSGVPPKIAAWGRSNFGSIEALLDSRIGSVAVSRGRIVGWCLPDSVADGRADIGVEMDEAHRRRGLAWATTVSTLNQALKQGIRYVGWHCDAGNVGSVKTAEKTGFQLQGEYPLLPVCMDPGEHRQLIAAILSDRKRAAKAALERGEVEEAGKLYGALLPCLNPSAADAETLFGAARTAALLHRREDALQRMEQAVACGWSFSIPLRTRPEFSELREDPRWTELIERIESVRRQRASEPRPLSD